MVFNKRTYFALLVSSVLLFFVIGCSSNSASVGTGKGKEPESKAPSPSASVSSPATSAAISYGNWDKIVEAAKKEGRVIVAGPPVPANRETIMQFEKAYPGIKLELTSTNPAEFEPRLIAERSAGKYLWDVYLTGTTASLFTKQIPNGLYDPIKPLIIDPAVLDESKWLGGFEGGYMDKDKKYVYAFGADKATTIQVNRDIVSEQEFTKMEDLLNPKWKGKIAMYDPRQRGFINIIFARFLDSLGEAGIKKLLTEQAPVYASSPAQLAEWAVRGSYPIIIGMGISERNRFVADGLGTKLRGVPGTEIVTNGWGNLLLVNKSPNPNAATVFINWMLSKEAQEDWVKRSNLNSRRIDVPNGNPDHHVEQAQQWLDGRLYNTETGAGKTEISIQIANDAMK